MSSQFELHCVSCAVSRVQVAHGSGDYLTSLTLNLFWCSSVQSLMNKHELSTRWTPNWCCWSVVSVKAIRNQMVPPCAEWWGERDNGATTPFDYCPSTAFLPVQPHCANARWSRCQEDLSSFMCGELEETSATSSYYVDEYYPVGPEMVTYPERSNWCGSKSSTLETDVYIWRYACLVVCVRNEWMNECENYEHWLSCGNYSNIGTRVLVSVDWWAARNDVS